MRIWEYVWKMLPGALGLAAAVFVYLALTCLIPIKEKRWRKVLLYIGCWQASFMIIYIGDVFNLSFGMAIFLAALWIACEGTGLKKFTLGLMFGSTIFAFNGFWDNGVAFAAHYYEKDDFFGDMYLVGRLVFAMLLYLAIRLQRVERDFELSRPLWRLMLLLTFSPMGIMVSIILLSSPYANMGSIVIADTALFLVVIFSFIGLLRALIVLERQQRLERENLLANQNQRYYEAMEQQQFEIRRLRHDLSNHLQALLALPKEQRDEYIKGMLDNPALGQVFTWCGDATVNAVLTAKEGLMRQKGIRFFAKADISRELPFEKADICAVLANALDNAAEGCTEVAESLREVHLEVKAGKGILAINIQNACKSTEAAYAKEKSAEKGRLPKTTKKDVKNHGFGLRSIQETVKKYGGSMEIERKEGTFVLFLYLPFPETKAAGILV